MRTMFVFVILMSCLCAGPAHAAQFTLSSPDIADGKPFSETQMLNGFGCEGGNVSPALSWENAPAGTKSFALTVYDPDAPTGSGWWHWVLYNIPADANALAAGAGENAPLPQGAVQSRTDFGAPGYGGACPPPGKPHRYIFTLRALNVEKLDLPADSSAAMVGFFLGQHTIEKTEITAVHGR